MALSRFNSVADAEAAGWAWAQSGRPDGGFVTAFERWLRGEPGGRGFILRVLGESPGSATSADRQALNNLNQVRTLRYGDGPAQNAGVLPGNAAWKHTPDVT